MRLRACLALLLSVTACATSASGPGVPGVQDLRRANLQRAAALPWTDGGQCAVREAARTWPVLAERCYPALDHDRVEFHDLTGRCAVASAGAAAVGLSLCVLMAPEFVAGAVILTGVVVVGFVLKEALDAYEQGAYPQIGPVPLEPSPRKRHKPEPNGSEFPPVEPTETSEQERRRRCEPIPTKHRGGHALHDRCADRIPNNSFPGRDVFVNGKNFDALQLTTRTLWEVKTDNFDTYPDELQEIVVRGQLPELRIERDLARACGFDFRIGVRSAEHKIALELADPELKGFIKVMDWC